MKRLLTCLFLVLGLGLVFNVSANAQILFCKKNNSSVNDITVPVYVVKKNKCYSQSRTISLEEYVDVFLGWQFRQKASVPVNQKIQLIKSIRQDFIDQKIDTTYLEKQLFTKYPLMSQRAFKKSQNIKKEPTQTQQVAKKEKKVYFCNPPLYNQLPTIRLKPCEKIYGEDFSISPEYYVSIIVASYEKYGKKAKDRAIQSLYDEFEKYNLDSNIVRKIATGEPTLIAKKEPKKKEKKIVKKEKKKKKVVKVVEQEQEEIKVKTKKLDTTGPEILIAEAITVDDSSYSLTGKVSDKGSDKIYLKIDGEDIPVKRGKFKIERYSPVDEEIKIVAIDKWGNKSTKVVKVTIDIKEEFVVQKLEPLNPSRAKGKTSGEKVALIIGIENYTEAPKANYADLDAKYFFDYARKAFGVKKQNIKLLINEDATFVKTNVALTLWLRTKVKADQTDLIVFFAGHGLASNDGKELYLLPQDSDPDLLSLTALSRTKLFQTIVDLKPKSVTMFLDTCYSGVSRDEQMLLASARPIRIVASDEGEIPDNFTIFSATELDQISSGLKEAKHGMFSYYLMKGLEGKADANKNKEITNGELLAYMDINVSQKALELGRQQNPSLAGDPDQVLMKY